LWLNVSLEELSSTTTGTTTPAWEQTDYSFGFWLWDWVETTFGYYVNPYCP
jgi:hypothetical protein